MSSVPEPAPRRRLEEVPAELRAPVHEMVGAAKGIRMMTTFGRVAETAILRDIRDQGAYETEGYTWERFCAEVIGRSRRSVEEDIQNLDIFGQEFMKMAESLNLGRGALRSLRSLPADQRPKILPSGEILFEDQRISVTPEHKDQLLEVLGDVLARQQQQEEQIELGRKQMEELQDTHIAQQKEIKQLKAARKSALEDSTPFEQAAVRLWVDYKRLCDVVNRDQPAPAEVLAWMRRCSHEHSELIRYGGELAPFEPLDPEEFDLEAMEEVLQEIDEADRA